MSLSSRIAFRHLKSPRPGAFSSFVSILAIIGLGLGIAALVLTVCIMNGFETTIADKIAGFDGHMRIQHFMNQPLSVPHAELDSVLSQSGVSIKSMDFIQQPALIRKGPQAEGLLIEAFPPAESRQRLSQLIVDGSADLSGPKILLGKRLAQQLGISVGDKVALFDMTALQQRAGHQRVLAMTVGGLFHSGLLEYDQSLAFISLENAQTLFNMKNQVSGLLVMVNDPEQVFSLSADLDQQLQYPYYVLNWKEKHRILFDWIRVQRWPILIIFGLIALVGIVNITAALSMIILEKTRQIGVLKAFGLSPSRIRKIFLWEGTVIGSLGSLSGALLALIIAAVQWKYQFISIPEDVYFMDHIPVGFDLRATIIIIFSGILISALAVLLPTRYAGRIKPAEALHYE